MEKANKELQTPIKLGDLDTTSDTTVELNDCFC